MVDKTDPADPRRSQSIQSILNALKHTRNLRSGISIQQLAILARVSIPTVRRCLPWLVDRGHLRLAESNHSHRDWRKTILITSDHVITSNLITSDHTSSPTTSPAEHRKRHRKRKSKPIQTSFFDPPEPRIHTIWDAVGHMIGSRAYLGKLIAEFGSDRVEHAALVTLKHTPADPKSYIRAVLRGLIVTDRHPMDKAALKKPCNELNEYAMLSLEDLIEWATELGLDCVNKTRGQLTEAIIIRTQQGPS